jgi:hypothetical protein
MAFGVKHPTLVIYRQSTATLFGPLSGDEGAGVTLLERSETLGWPKERILRIAIADRAEQGVGFRCPCTIHQRAPTNESTVCKRPPAVGTQPMQKRAEKSSVQSGMLPRANTRNTSL